jgi:hypothetical protein
MRCGVSKRDSVTRFSRHWPLSISLSWVYKVPSPVELKIGIKKQINLANSLANYFHLTGKKCLLVKLEIFHIAFVLDTGYKQWTL